MAGRGGSGAALPRQLQPRHSGGTGGSRPPHTSGPEGPRATAHARSGGGKGPDPLSGRPAGRCNAPEESRLVGSARKLRLAESGRG